MKQAVAILSILFMSLSFGFGQTKNLTIHLEGIEVVKGQIIVLVFDKKEDFPKAQELAKQYKFPVTGKSMTVVIKDLPMKDCALFIYHDEDSNGVCNQNKIGFPLERMGFSNNLRPKLKAPKFEDAKVPASGTAVSIQLYKM